MIDVARNNIIELIKNGLAVAKSINDDMGIHEQEMLEKRAAGYRNSVAALLHAFYELHNEMIEHPDYVALRRATRHF